MKRKREAFVKVFKKLSWFLLISGLGLILACRSWSQIRVLGLGRDSLLVFWLMTVFIRGYFRCTHQKLYQCPTKKLTQRLDDDPYIFKVTYRGSHTCKHIHNNMCVKGFQGNCHTPNPVPGFVTMTGMLISSLNLIFTRTNLTF